MIFRKQAGDALYRVRETGAEKPRIDPSSKSPIRTPDGTLSVTVADHSTQYAQDIGGKKFVLVGEAGRWPAVLGGTPAEVCMPT